MSRPSEEVIQALTDTEIGEHFNTKNHWNNEEWFGAITHVSGTGKYRFNQFGRTGFAHWQYRFKNKDEAIEFLCRCSHTLHQVRKGDGQYEVRTYYMEGF